MQNIRIEISGKVYKTGYRYFIKQIADLNNITGRISYVNKNSVCIQALGEKPYLAKFLSFCKMGNLDTEIRSFKFETINDVSQTTFEIR